MKGRGERLEFAGGVSEQEQGSGVLCACRVGQGCSPVGCVAGWAGAPHQVAWHLEAIGEF